MSGKIWEGPRLRGRKWENTLEDALFWMAIVNDWPNVGPRQLYEAKDLVRQYALDEEERGITFPLQKDGPVFWTGDVWILKSENVPIGGSWSRIEGDTRISVGTAVLPEYRRQGYHREAGAEQADMFFSDKYGIQYFTGEVPVNDTGLGPQTHGRVKTNFKKHVGKDLKLSERDGLKDKVHVFGYSKEDRAKYLAAEGRTK